MTSTRLASKLCTTQVAVRSQCSSNDRLTRNFSTDPPSPPARKRQRFSSPFEEYFEVPSQEDLAVLDKLEEKMLLQRSKHVDNIGDKENFALTSAAREHSKSPVKEFSSPSYDHHFRSSQTTSDFDNPFIAQMPSFTSANHLNAPLGFTSALHISAPRSSPDDRRSPSPDRSPGHDYTSWFAPAAIPAVAQFQSAKNSAPSSLSSPRPGPIATGFMKASNKGWAMPSHTALLQAEEKMKKIWAEGEDDVSSLAIAVPAQPGSVMHLNNDSNSSRRVADSQTPAGFRGPSIADDASSSTITANSEHHKRNAKPFKSPLMTAFQSPGPKSSLYASSPLNPRSQSVKSLVSAGSHEPVLATPGPDFPLPSFRPHDSAFVTPVRPQAAKRRVMSDTPTKSKFVTPFNIGMRPGEPGHERLVDLNKKDAVLTTMSVMNKPTLPNPEEAKADGQEPRQRQVFNLSGQQYPFAFLPLPNRPFSAKPPNRATLASCGKVPHLYNSADLEAMGMSVTLLREICFLTDRMLQQRAGNQPCYSDSCAILLFLCGLCESFSDDPRSCGSVTRATQARLFTCYQAMGG